MNRLREYGYAGLLLLAGLLLALLVGVPETASRAAASSDFECVEIPNPSTVTLYRCLDWQTGKVIYFNGYGFLFAVDEN